MGDSKETVAREVAEEEFERMVEAMDLDVDPQGMDEEERVDFGRLKSRIVGAMVRGRLTVDQDGFPVYTPLSGGEPVKFYEPTGATLMAQDKKKKGQDVAKMYAVMADMTQTSVQTFSKMPQRDLKVCMAVANLFLAG